MSKTPIICFICFSLKAGGGNKVIFEICDVIKRSRDMNYEIIAIDEENQQDENNSFSKLKNLKVKHVGLRSNDKLSLLFNLIITFVYIYVRSSKYQVIIINSPLLSPVFGLIGRKNIYNYIQADDYRIFDTRVNSWHHIYLLQLYKLTTKHIAYRSYGTRYIFNSQFTYEQFKAVRGKSLASINFIRPGVDLEVFIPQKVREKKGKLTISTILRKQPWKGSIDFVRVIDCLSNEILQKVQFVGITNEDISSISITEKITVCYPFSDEQLVALLQATDIFIVTSHWEGFGLPGLEAMACGCAVISTDNGGCNEYAIDQLNCLLYQSQNLDQLVELIVKIVDNESIRNQIISNALRTANKFSWLATTSNLDILMKSN